MFPPCQFQGKSCKMVNKTLRGHQLMRNEPASQQCWIVTGNFHVLHHAFKKYALILSLVYVISDIVDSQENN